ncbi:MAG: LPP20 family lipoprotein [Planctomycetes bacterium]|nr:LPP20 family lipoprotein [Planctomycetota bacterium]
MRITADRCEEKRRGGAGARSWILGLEIRDMSANGPLIRLAAWHRADCVRCRARAATRAPLIRIAARHRADGRPSHRLLGGLLLLHLLCGGIAACRGPGGGEATGDVPATGGGETSAAAGGMPGWCDTRQHPRFPSPAYIVGVGLSEQPSRSRALDEAKAAAIADIAQQFEVRILSEVTSYVRQSLRGSGDEAVARYELAGSTRVQQVAEGSFRFVQVGDQHYDQQAGVACVLAVIDRQLHFQEIEREIHDGGARMRLWIEEGASLTASGDHFQALQRYRQAEQGLIEQAALRAQAEFVLRRVEAPASVSLEDLYRRRREQEERIALELVVRHECDGARAAASSVEEAFISGLQEAGLLFAVRSRTQELKATDAEELSGAFDRWGRAPAAGGRQRIAVLCRIETRAYSVEHSFVAARSGGWVRLLDPVRGALLLSAAIESERDDPCRRVGLAGQIDSLAASSAVCAAARLAASLERKL